MEKFPKTVTIKIKHPEGLPEVNCEGQMGLALNEIGNYWTVRFYAIGKPERFMEAAFHKNSLEVIA